MRDWITAFQARYYQHLAQGEIHKDDILVLWKNEKGHAPVEEVNVTISFLHNKELLQWILVNEEENLYRKNLTTTFFLSGKKCSVVFGSVAFLDWTTYEKPKIDILIKEIREEKTLDKVTEISKQHQFPNKLISHPGEKTKPVEIIIPTSDFVFEANAKAQEHQGIQNLNMYAEKQIIKVKKSAIFQGKQLTVFGVENNNSQIDKDSIPSEHLELSDTPI